MGLISGQLLKTISWLDESKDVLVYRFPMEGRYIQMGSKITVRDSQVAVFVNKGQVADVFTPGVHTLSTNNLPFLTSLLSLPFGFKSPFEAEIYFINTKQFTNQKWGTTNPIAMRDKEFGTIRVRGYGSYSFRVGEPLVFLKELFGTNSSFSTDDINKYLKSLIITGITDTIASSDVSALDLAANLYEFADTTTKVLEAKFKALGLKLVNFNIENLSFPEEVEKALDTRASMGVMGDKMDTFMKYQAAQAMRDAANNDSGNGSMATMGMGMGAGMGFGKMMADAIGDTSSSTTGANWKCPKCKASISAGVKFCPECGTKIETGFCPDCGSKVPAGAKFCPECGAKMKK